jgi:N-acetylglucosamine kinase-like BadF-type ATPase
MILVADSGSTKTEWWWYDENNEIKKVITIGFNPYFIDSDGISLVLKNTLQPYINYQKIEKVFFYGSGCANENNANIVAVACKRIFPNATKIEVYPDTLGCARAVFGLKIGIAGILGTGSNAVYYDSKTTEECVPSLGYIIADEGSGARFGTILIREYFKNEMPAEIKEAFEKKYNPDLEHVLDAVYRQSHPNRFLASFCDFLSAQKEHPYIDNMIRCEIRAFLKYQVCKCADYKTLTLGLVGSVAFYLESFLREEAALMGITVGKILRSPIEGLIEFHQNYN